jgi:large repetitive protein
LNVVFTTTATDPEDQALSYLWEFGDGLVSTLKNSSHLYQTTGVYTACYKVTDAGGATASAQVVITVTGDTFQEPVVNMITPDGGEVIDGGLTYRFAGRQPEPGLAEKPKTSSRSG